MADMCGDNRFEIIARAKKALLEGTNIDTSPDEMAVIDNILFRCWQMGWLDKYDRKTESSEDECAKEYEELGLKELKELIEADRKTEQTERSE